MAKIRIERKKTVLPWIIAAIVLALLIWAVLAMMGRDAADTADTGTMAPVAPAAPVSTDPVATTATPRAGVPTAPASTNSADAATARDAALDRYAGTYGSGNVQLVLSSAGTYTMRESAVGEGQGRWSYDAVANALHLMPLDGSPDRHFSVEGNDTLTPLDPAGDPAAQMAPLQRAADR